MHIKEGEVFSDGYYLRFTMLPAFYILNIAFLALVRANSGEFAVKARDDTEVCEADEDEKWTYRGDKGPEHWGDIDGGCNGDYQSPININTAECLKTGLPPLEMNNYDIPVKAAEIKNNGHTIEVTPEDDVDRTIRVGDETYSLKQFHFHWGSGRDNRGSEHTVDCKSYPMEVHFVHMNSEGKIAVVGVFFNESEDPNYELQKIVDVQDGVAFKDNTITSDLDMRLDGLLPDNPLSFYRYAGSLTTPGCSQGVLWSVAVDPVIVGTSQLNKFREMHTSREEIENCKMSDNYRPVQPLNGRIVDC